MADLKTTYKDDVLNTSANEKRKYNMITNEDGTVSLEDATDYSQVGDSFGAADINATNEKVNELNTNLSNVLDGIKSIQFGTLEFTDIPKAIKEIKVTFKKPFETTPLVYVTYASGSVGSIEYFGASNVTNNSFSLVFKSNYDKTLSRKVNWIAIG